LRDEVDTSWMQFIPVVERVNADGQTLHQEGNTVSEHSVLPEQFGAFLSTIFDEWVRKDVGQVFVQTFEAAARNWLGLRSSRMCVSDQTCGLGLALEHNGTLLRTISSNPTTAWETRKSMIELVASERSGSRLIYVDSLPRYCRECDVRFACHGNVLRIASNHTDGEPGLNYCVRA
jgi:uncharacterized protein